MEKFGIKRFISHVILNSSAIAFNMIVIEDLHDP